MAWLLDLVTWPDHLTWHTTSSKQFHKVINSAHLATLPQSTLDIRPTLDIQPTLVIKNWLWCHPVSTTKPLTIWRRRARTVNHNKRWKWKLEGFILASELECFILAESLEVLEDYILAMLLNSHRQVESWKISSSLPEPESLIFALSIGMLEGFIFALLLEATA